MNPLAPKKKFWFLFVFSLTLSLSLSLSLSLFPKECFRSRKRKKKHKFRCVARQGYVLGVPLHPAANEQLSAILTEQLVRAHLLKPSGGGLDSGANGGSTMETIDGKTVRVRVCDQETLYPPGDVYMRIRHI